MPILAFLSKLGMGGRLENPLRNQRKMEHFGVADTLKEPYICLCKPLLYKVALRAVTRLMPYCGLFKKKKTSSSSFPAFDVSSY